MKANRNLFTKWILILAMASTSIKAFAQSVIDSVFMGSGFANEVYYSFEKGLTKTSTIADWDLSHTTVSRDNCLRLNHSIGWELRQYPNGGIADWATMDTSNWSSWPIYFNSPEQHLLGAFNRTKNSQNVWDFSWGVYNPNSHEVVGDSLFLLVKNGRPILKFWPIVQKINGDLIIQTQSFDGGAARKDTLLQSTAGKRHHKYLAFDQGQLNIEPLSTDWDIRFTQYAQPVWNEQSSLWVPNLVVGVQSSPSLRVKPIENHTWQWALDSVWYYNGPTRFDLNSIGTTWKSLDTASNQWLVQPNISYWVDNDSVQALLHFLAFEGASTGKIAFEFWPFEQTLHRTESTISTNAMAFPNPVSDQLFIPINSQSETDVALYNAQGQCVARSTQIRIQNGSAPVIAMPFGHLPSGRYVLEISHKGHRNLQTIIKP